MRFATIRVGTSDSVAAVSDDGLRYSTRIFHGEDFPGNMVSWIEAVDNEPVLLKAREFTGWRPLAEAELLAPLIPPRNIFCVGKNYRPHAVEFGKSGFDATAGAKDIIPDIPIFFTKATSCIVKSGDAILSHGTVTKELDYEAELAVIIGRGGKNIAPSDAAQHIFGYTIVNDVTARDLQKKHKQWFLGKSLDTFCPMGPWIATADGLRLEEMSIRCYVNDEIRQQDNPANLIFDIPSLISTLSAGMELMPGDVISTGTPAGVGIGFDPPRFLKPGDRITISIDGIGEISNSVL